LAGRADADAAARRILALEVSLAQVQWNSVDSRDVSKLYNPMSTSDMNTALPGLDWTAMLSASGLGQQKTIILFQPSALRAEAEIVAETPLSTWKEYLAFQTIAAVASSLSTEFVNADFAFNGTSLYGKTAITPRMRRGVEAVNSAMGQAVGQLYVAEYFTSDAKAQIDALVQNLVAAMDIRLANNPWMTPQTKKQARAKLVAMIPKVGYPEHWRDFGNLKIERGDVVGNLFRSRTFEFDRRLATLGKPVDRSAWSITPQTASAYSSAPMNDVVIPAAILQPPYFDPGADAAVNYGAIGILIGHEISHNFDSRGSQFDVQGRLNGWWTSDDRTHFTELSAKLVAQYEQYEPLPGIHVNGALTLSENMADLAGINIAYDAYRLSLGGEPAPVVDGYSGDQRFFLGFAQAYRSKQRPEALRQRLISDPHTPETARLNVVRNLDSWYDAFGVRPGQVGYLPPPERITIW
jgi:putative endopeptidase